MKIDSSHFGGMAVPTVASGVNKIVLVLHLVGLLRPAAAVNVRTGLHLVALDLVQQGREDPPGLGKLVGANKMHLRPDKDVKNESFVSIRQPGLLVPRVVRHV